ncbi:MAG: ATP-binding protein [Capsulimonadaceae bacterium]
MPGDEETALEIYEELRQLAFSDPLEAKRRLVELVDQQNPVLDNVLAAAGEAGDGRIRQIFARAVQRRGDKVRFVEVLTAWTHVETDEFALAAINDALVGTVPKRNGSRPNRETADYAQTFKYLSSRLRHRVLNILPITEISVDALRQEILEIGGDELVLRVLPQLDDFRVRLHRLDRAVNFSDEQAYFETRKLVLPDWFREYLPKYRDAHGTITIQSSVQGTSDKIVVCASQYLFEMVFSNLWNNAQQAVIGPCEITMYCRPRPSNVMVELVDNGIGFRPEDVERAFALQYSTKGAGHSGRGHMEVADAMRRLGGAAEIRPVPPQGSSGN